MHEGPWGVIFDCDGTLLDTMLAWRGVEDELARRAGGVLTKKDTDMLTVLTIPEAGEYLHRLFGLGRDGEEVVGMISELMLEHYRTQAHGRPGALDFVRGLAEQGVHMSVASSSPQAYLQAGLEHAGFMPYLQAVVSVDDVGSSKREPAVYERARSLMGTALEATWGFEDATYALHTLRNAGYHTVGVYDCDLSGTYDDLCAVADMTVRGFDELTAEGFLALARDAA